MASSAAIRRSRHKKKGLGGAPKRRTPPGWLADGRRATLDLRSYDPNKAYGQITHTVQQRFTAQQRIRPKQRVQIRTASKKRVSPTRDTPGASSLYGLFGLSVLGDPFRFTSDPDRARRRLGPTGPKASLCIACAKTVQQSHDKGKKDAQIVGSLASLSYLCSNFAAHP